MRRDPVLAAAIRAIPGWSGTSRVRVTPLETGITNRNFRVDLDGSSYVVRVAGRDTELLGIDREAERAAAEAAAAVGVGPEVVAFLPEHGCLITRFVEGAPVPPQELRRDEVLAGVVASIRAFHGAAPIPGSFSPFEVVLAYRDVARARGVSIPAIHERLLELADEIRTALGKAPLPARPCHNDLLNANFIRQGDRVLIVDYEYAGMGDPFFDLGNFSVMNDLPEEAQLRLLELYFGEVTPARRARLGLMRIMSDFREAMWGVVQQGISTLPFDYVGYADRHFDRCGRNAGDPRYERWLQDAAEAA